jgi:hypothetical protein
VKFGKDVKVEKEKVTSSTLSGFTADLLYKEYNTCIDYIDSNTPKMYEDLTSNINFINPNITQSDFEKIMKQLLYSYFTIFSDYLNNKPSSPYDTLPKLDTALYPEKTIEKFLKRVEKFNEPMDTKKFKFTNFKSRKSNKEIKFATNVTAEETDATIIEESKKVHSDNLSAQSDKLNYYRSTTKLLAGGPDITIPSNVA